jgi:hypothetical protein
LKRTSTYHKQEKECVRLSTKKYKKNSIKLKTNCSSSSLLGPKSVRDAAEVALDGADDVSVLCAGAPAAVDNSGEADQQGGQRAAAACSLPA